jgi:hypothetical protein
MKQRMFVGAVALLAGIAVGSMAKVSAAPSLKWALVNLVDATSIAGTFVSGPVMFVHDDAKMARGEPCTGVYRFNPGKGPGEELVSFHCQPRWKKAPDKFISATAPTPSGPRVLTEYQFAGDEEAHGVPLKTH